MSFLEVETLRSSVTLRVSACVHDPLLNTTQPRDVAPESFQNFKEFGSLLRLDLVQSITQL